MAEGFTVKLSGPLWKAAQDSEMVRGAVQKGMLQGALLGQRLVQKQLVPGHGVRTGTFRRSVVAEAGAWNKATVGSPLIYGPWLEGAGSRNKTSRFKGYRMFENAQRELVEGDLAGTVAKEILKVLGG